jgi:hypothetical protein
MTSTTFLISTIGCNWRSAGIKKVVLVAITFRKKFLAIPLVAASETGTAQTVRIYMYGVVGRSLHLVAKSYKVDI